MNKKSLDAIDRELTKTYFGATPNKNVPDKNIPKKNIQRIHLVMLGIVSIVVITLSCAVFITAYLFYNDKKRINAVDEMQADMEKIYRTSPPAPPEKKIITYTTPVDRPLKEGVILYGFEQGLDGWDIPGWALEKPDHVARDFKRTTSEASEGEGSLEIQTEFSKEQWTAALVEIPHFLDLNKYDRISSDLFIPAEAPTGLKAKLIFTIGEDWAFIEIPRASFSRAI